MKRRLFSIFILWFAGTAFSQDLSDRAKPTPDPSQKYTGIGGGLGASIFNGKPYLLLNAAYQDEIAKTVGFAIDGYIRIGSDGKLRKEDFDDWYDALRWISYVRIGHPGEDLYA